MSKAQNIVPKKYEDMAKAVGKVLSKDTSNSVYWSEETPEQGHCAVVALLLQEAYGGNLLRALVAGESHYWNEIDGETVDFTRAQFEEPILVEEPVLRERAYVLSFPETASRYELLKSRVLI